MRRVIVLRLASLAISMSLALLPGVGFAAPAPKPDVYDPLPKGTAKGYAEFVMATFDGSDATLGALKVRWSGDDGLFSNRKLKFGRALRIAAPPGAQRFYVGATAAESEEVPIEEGKVTRVDVIVSRGSSDGVSTTYSVQVIVRTPKAP